MYQDFIDHFSYRMEAACTESEREQLLREMATARGDLFTEMKARIGSSCIDFGRWGCRHMNTQLQQCSTDRRDDDQFKALVALLESEVFQNVENFEKRTMECARAVWEEFAMYLGLEREFIPA
ncbi:hypothetical protein V5799_013853 [Amblyomma americanum]|uniref:Uncharacterized protein n=1 Tax=Amblyomma americanum TaxID=6943 RepID=A0AAQ4E4W2_AMBAM